MAQWFTRFVNKLFGPGRPPATSDALMVGPGGKSAARDEEKSVLSIALERAKAPERSLADAPPPLLLETAVVDSSGEDDVGEPKAKPKKAAKKRAGSPRKRKAAAPAPSEDQAVDVVPEAPVAFEDNTVDFAPEMAASEAEPDAGSEADVWVSDAVAWSLSGRWSADEEMWSPPPGAEAPKRLEEFREKAAEGKLVIWGRAGEVGMWEPIEAAYWRSCGIEQFSFLEGREKVFTEPKIAAKAKPGKKANEKYTALRVNRRQVEEVWQNGAMH